MTADYYYGFWDNSIFETPSIEDLTESLTSEVSRLFGASCELTEPVASDWNQASSEVVRWAEANPHTFIAPRQPNRPVCVLAPVGRQSVRCADERDGSERSTKRRGGFASRRSKRRSGANESTCLAPREATPGSG